MDRYTRIIFVAFPCLYFLYYIGTYTEWHFIDNVDLIFHEAGHTIFFFLGEYVQVLAGSAFQILLPLFISIYFFVKDQRVSASLCLLWVGANILNVSVYAGDAVSMKLDLLGGDSVIHDWNYLLSNTGLLGYTDTIARCMYSAGVFSIIIGSILAVYYALGE